MYVWGDNRLRLCPFGTERPERSSDIGEVREKYKYKLDGEEMIKKE